MKDFKYHIIDVMAILTVAVSFAGCSKDDEDPVSANATLTYNTNRATSGTMPDAVTQATGTSITLNNDTDISYTGYTFAGWNTNANGTGTNYAGGSSFILNNNVTLFAKWNEEASGSASNLKITVGNNMATAILYDNGIANDFKSRLPLTVTMTDYSNTEKSFIQVQYFQP
nr:cyclophilin-like fold protein [Myroides odoratimimus]